MALWTPAEIPTALWLDASDASTITIDTGISEWRDKSGNSRSPANSVDASQPALITAGLNGLDVARFDGSNDYLLFPSSTATDYPLKFGTGSFALFAVIKPAALSAATNIFFGARGYDVGWFAGFGTDDPYFRMYNAAERWAPAPMSAITATTAAQIFVATAPRGAIGSYRKDGSLLQSTSSNVGTQSLANALQVRLGSYVDGSNNTQGPFNGDIAELVLIAGTVTAETIEQIEGYLAWKWGLQANLPADHPYKDAAPVLPTAVRAVFAQPYDLQPYLVRAILDQPYGLTIRLAQLFDQVYGLRMMTAFEQRYGDAARLRNQLDQYYDDAAKLRKKFEQVYGNSPKYRAALDQLYNLHAGLRAALVQDYSISEGQVRAAFDEIYNIQNKDLLRQTLDMLYVLAAGEALVQRFDIEVKCDGVVHNSMSNINIEQDCESFYMAGDLQLYYEGEALQYRPYASEVEITVDGWTCHLIAGMMKESRQPGQTIYVVPLFSESAWMEAIVENGLRYRLAAGELSGMASELVATLAAPFTVDWQLVDWFIPPGRLAVNEGDAAINVIRRITEAVGGIIQTDPDGVLICLPEYPVSVDKWDTVEPDFYLTDQDDFFQIDHNPELRNGYNMVQVSDQQLAAGGLTLDVTNIDPYVSEVRVYQVPWDDDSIIRLRHSGDPGRVSIVAGGSRIETIADEQVEIVAGSGRTSKPFYHLVSADYREAELGAVTIAEDGNVTTATAENSLVHLTYWTRCWLFTVTDHTAEDVQFFPEESAA